MDKRYVVDSRDGVETDNRGLDETVVSYKDDPETIYEVSIPFALDLVENAFENDERFEDGLEGTPVGNAINLLRELLKG